jgi:hypothetical protein
MAGGWSASGKGGTTDKLFTAFAISKKHRPMNIIKNNKKER